LGEVILPTPGNNTILLSCLIFFDLRIDVKAIRQDTKFFPQCYSVKLCAAIPSHTLLCPGFYDIIFILPTSLHDSFLCATLIGINLILCFIVTAVCDKISYCYKDIAGILTVYIEHLTEFGLLRDILFYKHSTPTGVGYSFGFLAPAERYVCRKITRCPKHSVRSAACL